MTGLIALNKSIIPSCDVATLEELRELVKQTCNVKGIGAYKIGFELVIPFGMKKVLEVIREFTDIPVIYDHQKAGTDVPFVGEKFIRACEGADAVIIFPQAGPETEKAFIKASMDAGMKIIVGGEMTHPAYLAGDGGYLKDDTPERIYTIAAEMGVTDFVVPGNKPEMIRKYRKFLVSKGIDPVFYSPGLVAQGGKVSDSAKAAGDKWHAIVGRGIYSQKDMRKAAEELVDALK
ncbi:MAG: orotidine 5'-phosphate decarboxylase [Candidatus Aenigmarchaeota archaeon]|nr:orotidine 5'-phosphate decarboxylase [Candidatus Aenigmarchaeota archaeon]